jgi:co-chaperonin GroES (HSP10)
MSSVPFKPMRGRILVENIMGGEETTASGLIIPASEIPDNKALVIKAGEGAESLEGSTISYRDEAGRGVRILGKDYLLMYEADIDGIYE